MCALCTCVSAFLQERSTMDLHGEIIKVSKAYCYVVLSPNRKIHFSPLLANDPSLRLPEIGAKVHLKNCYGDIRLFALTSDSTIDIVPEQDSLEPEPSNPFMDYVRDHALSPTDLVNVDPLLTMLEDNFPEASSSKELLKDIFWATYPLGILLSGFPFSVSHYRRVEIMSDKYNDFPYWSFGVYYEHTDLFGLLYFDTTFGFLLIKDSNHRFPLIIPNISEYCLETVLDCYVMVRNFNIFTEIYKDKFVPNVEYAIATFESIKVVSRVRKQVDIGVELPTERFSKSVCFTVLRKSMPCIGDGGTPEVWFEIAVSDEEDPNFITDTCFLILSHKHIKVASMLQESCMYKMFHYTPLQKVKEPRLSRFKPYEILKLSSEDDIIYFQILKKGKHEKLLSVAECKQHIQTSKEIVSFEGVLTKKLFNDPISLKSSSKKKASIYGYGTPGVKTHYLVFSFSKEQGSVSYLDCYLNDWENISMPLGLIPSMRVKVKHMIPQSQKYLKSTPFTSFEVLGYEPVVRFQTVNLYLLDDVDWGNGFYFGKGNELPLGTLIWGKTHLVEVLSIKLTTTCSSCQDLKEMSQGSRCSCPTKEIDCLIKLQVKDQFGQSRVLAKDLKVLRLILDLTKHQFKFWLKAFKQIPYFEYSIWDKKNPLCNIREPEEEKVFKCVLKDLIKHFNKCSITEFDLKCRLLSYSPNQNYGQPLWFLIDAR